MLNVLKLDKFLPLLAGLVAAAAPAYLIRFSIFDIPTTALEILIYAFAALVIFTQWKHRRPVPRSFVWPILLFIVAAVISTLISPDKRVALGILKAWIFAPLIFSWAFYQLRERRKALISVITGLVAGALAVSSVAIVQRLVGEVTVDGRVVGPYGWFPAENASPNYLALYLGPLGVLAAGIGIGSLAVGRRRGWLSLFGAGLIALAIYFSFSRAGLAALALGIGIVLVMYFGSWISQRIFARLTLLVLIVLSLIFGWYAIRPDPLLSPEEGGRITASNNVRWEIWKTTFEISNEQTVIGDLPVAIFGVGLGNFQNYFTEHTEGRVNYDRIAPLALTPHNFFLSLWVNLGLGGVIAIVWLLVVLARQTAKPYVNLQKTDRGSLNLWILVSLAGSLIALLAHGLLDTPYFKGDLSLLFWTLTALLLFFTDSQTAFKSKEER